MSIDIDKEREKAAEYLDKKVKDRTSFPPATGQAPAGYLSPIKLAESSNSPGLWLDEYGTYYELAYRVGQAQVQQDSLVVPAEIDKAGILRPSAEPAGEVVSISVSDGYATIGLYDDTIKVGDLVYVAASEQTTLPPGTGGEQDSADGIVALPAAQEALLDWAVSKWNDEVANRPLVNIHRRSLDDTWRQVIRYAGGDPDALVGPSHDALLATPAEAVKPAEGK